MNGSSLLLRTKKELVVKTTAKGKRPVRKKTLKAAGGAKSTQLKTELNKTVYGSLITVEVLNAVSKTVTAIDKALTNERKTSVQLGVLLGKLRKEFFTHLKHRPDTIYITPDKKISWAFHHFIRMRFKIGVSRANEYIKLAEREDVHKIELPISVLIELCRLEEVKLKEFVKAHPPKELQELSFTKVKKLIRGENTNKRDRASKEKEEESPQQIVETLKSTFEVVRDKFEDSPEIDKEIYSVIGEMSKWLIDKKAA